jgi:hypothetical protein
LMGGQSNHLCLTRLISMEGFGWFSKKEHLRKTTRSVPVSPQVPP